MKPTRRLFSAVLTAIALMFPAIAAAYAESSGPRASTITTATTFTIPPIVTVSIPGATTSSVPAGSGTPPVIVNINPSFTESQAVITVEITTGGNQSPMSGWCAWAKTASEVPTVRPEMKTPAPGASLEEQLKSKTDYMEQTKNFAGLLVDPSTAMPVYTTATRYTCTFKGMTSGDPFVYRVYASNALGATMTDARGGWTIPKPSGLSINDGADYTNSPNVKLSLTLPAGAESQSNLLLSNDGGFRSPTTMKAWDFIKEMREGRDTLDWKLVQSGDERLPKTVYVRFYVNGVPNTFTDDIILDTTAPTLTSATAAPVSPSAGDVSVQSQRLSTGSRSVQVKIRGTDKNSGVGRVQIKTSAKGTVTDVPATKPKAASHSVRIKTSKKQLWIRIVDLAGNPSRWVKVAVR